MNRLQGFEGCPGGLQMRMSLRCMLLLNTPGGTRTHDRGIRNRRDDSRVKLSVDES
jgi:hypothetical protein